ncbi:hypothetical protein [Aquipseudomonas alcaligenes]|uniref:hypothetical protein n=1 Tax=Aquipseudomonas alcaligenes TaxID=43263 RepID=UPI001659C2D1|nr:hypothetical protein [Pseudomonas alcaligenes]
MKYLSLLTLVALLSLGGCSLYLPGIGIEVGDYPEHGGPPFCPPGQAKKGNC